MISEELRQIKRKAVEISILAFKLRMRTERILEELKAINTPEQQPKKHHHHGRIIQRIR